MLRNNIDAKIIELLETYIDKINSLSGMQIFSDSFEYKKILTDSYFFLFELKRILKNKDLISKSEELKSIYYRVLSKVESFRYRDMCENFYYLQFNIDYSRSKRNSRYSPEKWMQINNFEMLSCLATAIDAIDENYSLSGLTFYENFMVKPKYLQFAAEYIIRKRNSLLNLLIILIASSLKTASVWFDYLNLKPPTGYEYRAFNPNNFKKYFLKFALKLNKLPNESMENCNWELFVYLLASLRFFESKIYRINTKPLNKKKQEIIKLIEKQFKKIDFENYPIEKMAYLIINFDDICPYYLDNSYFEQIKDYFLKKIDNSDVNMLIHKKEMYIPQILRALLRIILKIEKFNLLSEISIPSKTDFRNYFDIIKKIIPNTQFTRFEIKDKTKEKKAWEFLRLWDDKTIRKTLCEILIKNSNLSEIDKSELINSSKTTHDSSEIADFELNIGDKEPYYVYMPVKSNKEGGKKRSIGVPIMGDQYLRPFRKGKRRCVIIISIKPLSSALINSIHDYREMFKIPIFYLADESLFRFIFYHKPELLRSLK